MATYYIGNIPYGDKELYHFGIKGMKWGVRRYQNEDGSLTEAGKKRYYRDGGLTKKGLKKLDVDAYNSHQAREAQRVKDEEKAAEVEKRKAERRAFDGFSRALKTGSSNAIKDWYHSTADNDDRIHLFEHVMRTQSKLMDGWFRNRFDPPGASRDMPWEERSQLYDKQQREYGIKLAKALKLPVTEQVLAVLNDEFLWYDD